MRRVALARQHPDAVHLPNATCTIDSVLLDDAKP